MERGQDGVVVRQDGEVGWRAVVLSGVAWVARGGAGWHGVAWRDVELMELDIRSDGGGSDDGGGSGDGGVR